MFLQTSLDVCYLMMSKKSIYLDYAAGTPVSQRVLKAALAVAGEFYANPSALHAPARAAATFLAGCRAEIAQILAVKASSLIFTAGATEANNLINLALRQTYPGAKLVCLNIDHDSWRLNADYCLKVEAKTGQLKIEDILNLKDDVCCLSLAGINPEIGVIQPFALLKESLSEVRRQRQERGNDLPLLLHVDASQMALTHNLQPQALAEADLLTLNGAKFYTFKQSGLIYMRPNLQLQAPFKGGTQERSFRPGSESVLLAAGLKIALKEATEKRLLKKAQLSKLQTYFEAQLEVLGAEIVLKNAARSPHISLAIFKGHDNETLALKLSQAGIYVGTGSACHSRPAEGSGNTLQALGYSQEETHSALRFSWAYETKRSHLEAAFKVLAGILGEAQHA